MIGGSPPFQVSQEVSGLLGSGPDTARQSRYSMTDRQIHPFNKSSVEPVLATWVIRSYFSSLELALHSRCYLKNRVENREKTSRHQIYDEASCGKSLLRPATYSYR
jgi:hypothetical protein